MRLEANRCLCNSGWTRRFIVSPGGPGKWARMAARGYAPRTAFKHLVRLWHEPASAGYRLRMTLETLARIAISLPRLPLHALPAVPGRAKNSELHGGLVPAYIPRNRAGLSGWT